MIDDRFAIDPNLVRHPKRGPIYYAFWVLIPIQVFYLFAYNHLPEQARMLLSSALFAAHLGLGALTLLGRPSGWNLLLLVSILLTILTWIPAHVLGMGEVSAFGMGDLLRNIAWPLMLIWVLSYPLSLPRSLLCWYAVLFTLLGAVIALTGPPVYVSGTARLASITSGLDNMHASAKLMALQILLLDQLRRAGLLDARLAWPLIVLAGAILLGFGGRNELVFVLCYFAARIYFAFRHDLVIRFAPLVATGLAVVAAIVVLQIVAHPGTLGSGRIGVWSYRLWLIAHRDPVTFFFGGGVGADIIWTPQWWFFEDGASAHNDYLHIVMESGIVGLLAMFILMYALWLRLPDDGRAILVAIGVNSFFANGFFTSPLLALSLSFVMATSLMGALMRQAEAGTAAPPPRRDQLHASPPPTGMPQT